jgi:phospholipid/cholesterol/gamma-HCH transport system substrate-binding protein
VRWLSRLVSIVVFASLVVGLGLCVRSKMPATKVGESFTTCAAFRDGSKLAPGSPVLIAGVRVGEISSLRIDGALARIELRLRDDTRLPIDSWITKRAFSPFGDSYIEIIPGGPDEDGAPTGVMLRSGECLHRVAEGASTDRILRQLDRIMPKVDNGLDRLHEVGEYGRKWAAGTLAEGVTDAERWLDETKIERPLRATDQALARLEKATAGAAAAVSGAKPGIGRTMSRLERGVVDARRQMAQVQVDLRDGLQKAREGMSGGDDPIADFEELLAAIDEGRGSDSKGQLGRLINDPKLGDQIEDAVDAAREGVSTFTRFKSWLGLRIEFNVFSREPRFYLSAEIRARTDKFYLVELEKGPLGDFPDDQLSDATSTGTWNRRQEIKDRLRFTAQFGKTYGNWFQIRGGLKESTFGIGTDFLVGNGRLKLSADLYGGYTRTPRIKLAGALAVFRSIYVIAGIDDALSSPGYLSIHPDPADVPIRFDQVRFGRDYFVGATLHFDDADLAVLLRVYGALLVSLL